VLKINNNAFTRTPGCKQNEKTIKFVIKFLCYALAVLAATEQPKMAKAMGRAHGRAHGLTPSCHKCSTPVSEMCCEIEAEDAITSNQHLPCLSQCVRGVALARSGRCTKGGAKRSLQCSGSSFQQRTKDRTECLGQAQYIRALPCSLFAHCSYDLHRTCNRPEYWGICWLTRRHT
jgi:hypothetical protein